MGQDRKILLFETSLMVLKTCQKSIGTSFNIKMMINMFSTYFLVDTNRIQDRFTTFKGT